MIKQSDKADFLVWWDELSFPGKELFNLKEGGELMLLSFGGNNERIIATINPDNASAAFKSLSDRFTDLENKLAELLAEWNTTEDKIKLSGKVERLKDAILHTNAVGALDALLKQVMELENSIQTLSQEIYQAKLAIVEQAEKLIHSEDWKETTQAFREFVDQWKVIGHVVKAKNDALWTRLEEARNKFYERKRQHQEMQEQELMQNLDKKMELVEKAENLIESKKWKDTSEVYRTLMEQWKAIGRTTHDKNEELWNRFIAAKNTFFESKKEHFDKIQKEQDENYRLKSALLEKAEELKDSTDWAPATQAYAEILTEWKKIGRVPADKGDELWDKFNLAKDHFFNAKQAHFNVVRASLEENLVKKRELLQRAESLKNSSKWREATIELNELMDEWKKIGSVPREHSDKIWEAFINARRHFFDKKDAHFEDRRKLAEKQIESRSSHTRSLINKLLEEIKEEEEKLTDFREGLENITPGHKAEELRKHLQNLIAEGEVTIKRKQEKLESVRKEIEQMEAKVKPKAGPKQEKEENAG